MNACGRVVELLRASQGLWLPLKLFKGNLICSSLRGAAKPALHPRPRACGSRRGTGQHESVGGVGATPWSWNCSVSFAWPCADVDRRSWVSVCCITWGRCSMSWEDKFSSIVKETESNLSRVRVSCGRTINSLIPTVNLSVATLASPAF